MIKKIFFTLIISAQSLATLSAQQQYSYQLKGKTSSSENGKTVYLKWLGEDFSDLITLDSTTIRNNAFSFDETLDAGSKVRLIQIEDPAEKTAFYVSEEGNIVLDLTKDKQKVSGTSANNELQQLLDKEDALEKQSKAILEKFKSLDSSDDNEIEATSAQLDALGEKAKKLRFDYMQNNLNNDQGIFAFLSSIEMFSPDTVLITLNNLKSSFRESNLANEIRNFYESQMTKVPGEKFTDFELKDLSGKSVKLSDYAGKGKVVLLDFWASWCMPCIKEMPALVELYEKYKDQDFEIVGVSFDEDQQRWQNAITKHGITWPQMSDLKGWKSAVAKPYAVYSIPLTLLINKDGIIVGENLKGNELTSKIDELLK